MCAKFLGPFTTEGAWHHLGMQAQIHMHTRTPHKHAHTHAHRHKHAHAQSYTHALAQGHAPTCLYLSLHPRTICFFDIPFLKTYLLIFFLLSSASHNQSIVNDGVCKWSKGIGLCIFHILCLCGGIGDFAWAYFAYVCSFCLVCLCVFIFCVCHNKKFNKKYCYQLCVLFVFFPLTHVLLINRLTM